jgi:hypothetical protein
MALPPTLIPRRSATYWVVTAAGTFWRETVCDRQPDEYQQEEFAASDSPHADLARQQVYPHLLPTAHGDVANAWDVFE